MVAALTSASSWVSPPILFWTPSTFQPSAPRWRRPVRDHAAPVFGDLERWLAMRLTEIPGKSPLADTLARIPDCKINRITGLLPWRWNG
ncbi:hypothetical protein KY389_14430 [Paracoccus bogoriensis]|nr:hypothetical protein [Paracoccus bogoriensis]